MIFFGLTCLTGVAFLIAASLTRWRPADAGWRAALYSAGFGMAVLGGVAPLGGQPLLLLALIVAGAAHFFVGVSALTRRAR